QFKIRGFDVNFEKEWQRIDFGEIMQKEFGIDVYNTTVEEVEKVYADRGITDEFEMNLPRGIDYLWKTLRRTIAGPAFLINHPAYLSPLAKPKADNPAVTERFQPIIAGSELGNGWSESNSPEVQLQAFLDQQ